jgi:hypothetical protein
MIGKNIILIKGDKMLIVKACIFLFFILSWHSAFQLFRSHKSLMDENVMTTIETLRDMLGEKLNSILLAVTIFVNGIFLFIDFFAAMNGYIYFINTEHWFLYLTCSFFVLQIYQMIVEGNLIIRCLSSIYGFVETLNRYERLKKDPVIKYITVYGWAFLSAYLVIHII